MARIPKIMLIAKGRRISFIDVYSLVRPILEIDNERGGIVIANPQSGCIYRFTLDGSDPDDEHGDTVQDCFIEINESCTLKVQSRRGQEKSVIVEFVIVKIDNPVFEVVQIERTGNPIFTIS